MDYFIHVLTTFLEHVQKALGFHQNYLNLYAEKNKGLAGLERHEDE